MRSRNVWIPIAAVFTLLVLFLLALCAFEHLIPSFPQLLLGQVVMTQDSGSPSPRAYQSAEFILGEVALSEVERGVYIDLKDDVLFWEPDYVGFARAELTEAEILHFWQLLSGGVLYDQDPDGTGFRCITGLAEQQPTQARCAEGADYQERYSAYRQDAIHNRSVGVLQIYLKGWRLVEIRIYPSDLGVAFAPYEKSGDWWFDGISAPSDRLQAIASRAVLPSIDVLWPHRSSARANRRGLRIIGDQYKLAQEVVWGSSDIREVLGVVQELRPATGINLYSSWMDATSVFLTFRVIGTQGEGAVIVRGYDCFDLQMVFQGEPVKKDMPIQCP